MARTASNSPERARLDPLIADNVFAGNTAWEGAGMRLCFFWGAFAEPAVRFNTIVDNEAISAGGGIAIYAADPVIVNCTFDGNSAGSTGGGVYAAQCEEAPVMTNTIVANSGSGGGVALVDATFTTSFCDVWNNTGGDYINCGPAPTDMSVDPLYCDLVDRDLTLRDDSPCLPENNPWSALIGAHEAGGCGTSVSGEMDAGVSFRLDPPSPNPASGPVTMSFELGEPGEIVELTVLTVGGRIVRQFTATGPAGRNQLVWDTMDGEGRPVASGVYLVRGRTAGRSSYRGIVVLRRQR